MSLTRPPAGTRPPALARSSAAGAGPGLDETSAVRRAVADDRSDGALRSRRLPRVLHDSPASVLLLDLSRPAVVQANRAGRGLAPDCALPAALPDWVRGTRLAGPDGAPYAPAQDPVSRISRGEPVQGEPVLVGADRTPVWLTGFPIPRAGTDPHQALVVMFAVDPGEDAEIRDRAVVAAGLSFTISDPRLPDNPLVFVNPAFERTTGWSWEEVEGRNCRFLQGPDTDPAAVQQVRDALAREEHRTITLLNYRKDGSAFWNELAVSPVYDATGELTHFVGIQSDVTTRVAVEQERERHLAAERAARSEAERAQRQLALLAEATSMLAATLDVDESLDRLTSLVVPLMADWCTVHLLDAEGRVQRVAARHREPEKRELLRRLEQLQPAGLAPGSQIVVLDRLDQLVQGLDMAQLATCVYGRLDLPAQGRPGRLRLANAGHLPPALRDPDGSVRLVATEPSLLVGAALGTDRRTTEVPVECGAVLVLYTDGLVEHRGRGLDEGLDALQEALRTAPDDDARSICEHLLAELAGDLDDDVALLVVRVLDDPEA